MRLNLGCGHLPLPGYVNVDKHADEANVRGDVRTLDFQDVEEVVMYHLLEHIPWREAIPTLARIRSWMVPGAEITVEVPDMARISPELRPGSWVTDTYGSQEHEGECHLSGYTAEGLRAILTRAGFDVLDVRAFDSPHTSRPGMPCIEARATA